MGENCPWGEVIGTEDQCKDAASKMANEDKIKMAYDSIWTAYDSPAGCFFQCDGSTFPPTYHVYFNNHINPSETLPKEYFGGLCYTRQGR